MHTTLRYRHRVITDEDLVFIRTLIAQHPKSVWMTPAAGGLRCGVGCSYLGFTKLFVAALLPKNSSVKAMAPLCAGTEQYREANLGAGLPTRTITPRGTIFQTIIGQGGGDWGRESLANIIAGGGRLGGTRSWSVRGDMGGTSTGMFSCSGSTLG